MHKAALKELHLLIVWNSARGKQQEILSYIEANFQLLDKYPITWDKASFSKNISRFYGKKLPPKSSKVKECGNGEFLLITFVDNDPKHDFVETTRGSEIVNLNVFKMKMRFRELTGGGSKIHATNSPGETRQDLALLLGVSYDDYVQLSDKDLAKHHSKFSSKKGLVGFDGWDSLEHFFYIMNSCINYVVLRNYEVLPYEYYAESHGDIDFLVEDFDAAVTISNASKIGDDQARVYHTIGINGTDIFVDFRYLGDNYYAKNWQESILRSRVYDSKGFYHPDATNYYYSLVYHVLVHKKDIAEDYPLKLEKARKGLFKSETDVSVDFDSHYSALNKYLVKNQYNYQKPTDRSVYFDSRYIDLSEVYVDLHNLKISRVSAYLTDQWKNGSGFTYYLGEDVGGDSVFIKYGGLGASAKREYQIIRELVLDSTKNFPHASYYTNNPPKSLLVLKKIEGTRLDKIDISQTSIKFQDNVYQGLYSIIKILRKKSLVHRDVRPQNIIIKGDGTPILIDFQFTIDVKRKKYKELKAVRKNPKLIRSLGGGYARGAYDWDDAYSLLKILNESEFMPTPALEEIRKSVELSVGDYRVVSMRNDIFSIGLRVVFNILEKRRKLVKKYLYIFLYRVTSKQKYLKKLKRYG